MRIGELLEGLTFKGYPCTYDCSGHQAGHLYATHWGLEPEECPYGNSNSFWEGCKSYGEEDLEEEINSTIVKDDFYAENIVELPKVGKLKFVAYSLKKDNPPQFRVDVIDEQGQKIGYFRFIVMGYEPEPRFRLFAKKTDPYIIGGNVSVWNEYQRKGIASAVYSWIRSMGNDIRPSTTQTDAGRAMWRSFDKDTAQGVAENFADGKVKGKSRPGRVKRAGASCNGSVTDLRKRAKNASGEKAKMYHWCANMKSGRKK